MKITRSHFGEFNGKEVQLFTLDNGEMQVGVLDFGGIVNFIKLATPNGEVNACLGYDSVEGYLAGGGYCSVTVGRVANRIANSRFTLEGREYEISANEGVNSLHGGKVGFDRNVFDSSIEGDVLVLSHVSPDGDMGYPGTLNFKATFTLEGRALLIKYYGKSDKTTLFSPTCHAYFNLGGGGKVFDTLLKINADYYTPTDDALIPLGVKARVKGTPLDFTSLKKIGEDYDKLGGKTYDHNFCLNGANAVSAHNLESGVTLDMSTDLPAVQLYVGGPAPYNGKGGGHGFCLEPQYIPNAINVEDFESPILKAGEEKCYFVKYSFGF